MEKRFKIIFTFFLILLIEIPFALSEMNANQIPINPLNTSRTIEIKPECYSDGLVVTRYFYILNNGMDNMNIQKNSYVYGFAVGDSLNPKLDGIKDNFGNIYQDQFYKDGNLELLAFRFPAQDIQIGAHEHYLITSIYEARTAPITKEGDIKKLKMNLFTTGDYALDELRIVLPNCFGLNRQYIDSIPKPTEMSIIDEQLILTYKKPVSAIKINDAEINMSNIYDPTVRFEYTPDTVGLIIYIFGAITAALIGIAIRRAILKKNGRIKIKK